MSWRRRRPPLVTLPPIVVHGREVVAATREEDAQTCEAACDWRTAGRGVTHEQHHYGFPCPYAVCAALLRGEPDPRLQR